MAAGPGRLIRCAVPGCPNWKKFRQENPTPGLFFFSIPRGRELAWAEAIGNGKLAERYRKCDGRISDVRVCSAHFRQEDVQWPDAINTQFNMNFKGKLKKDAIPSLNLPVKGSESRRGTVKKEAKLEVAREEDGYRKEEEEEQLESQEEDLILTEPCLICSGVHCRAPTSNYKFWGSSEVPLLNDQLWSTFVLRQVLDLPSWKFEEMLKLAGNSVNPGQWFVVCEMCTKSLVQVVELEEKVRNLQGQISKLKEQVRERFKEGLETGQEGDTNFLNVGQEIKTFFATKVKSELPSAVPNKKSLMEIGETMATSVPPPKLAKMEEDDSSKDADWAASSESEISWPGDDLNDNVDDLDQDKEEEDPSEQFQDIASSLVKKEKTPITGKRFKCKKCSRAYYSAQLLKSHLKLHQRTKLVENGRFDCCKCGAPYDNVVSVQRHLRNAHGLTLHMAWTKTRDPQKDYVYSFKTKKAVLAKLKAKKRDISGPARYQGIIRPTQYSCPLCPKKLSLKGYLDNHLEYHQHTKQKYNGRFDCCKCRAPFINLQGLRRHLRTEHKLALDGNWLESGGLQEPYLVDYKPPPPRPRPPSPDPDKEASCDAPPKEIFECTKCSRTCTSIKSLRHHTLKKHKVPLDVDRQVCDLCGYVAKGQTLMKSHIIHHKIFDHSIDPAVSTTQFICNVCKRLFSTRRNLSFHKVNAHAEELGLDVFKCRECPRQFLKKGSWLSHEVLVHKKEGKYKCPHCDYQTMGTNSYDKHVSKHSTEKELCPYCPATYASDQAMRKHFLRYHPDQYEVKKRNLFVGVAVEKLSVEGDAPTWNFTLKKDLQKKDKPTTCKYCEAVLPHKLAFNLHLKDAHKDLYKYQCDLCERVYLSATSLNLHVKINHKEKDKGARCGWCGNKVAHRIYLYSHAKVCPKKPKGGENVPKIVAVEDTGGDNKEVEGAGQDNFEPRKKLDLS